MSKWTTEEELVLLYYASRRVRIATIVDLLAKKCRPKVRNAKQIAHKASRLRRVCGQKELVLGDSWPTPDREWDLKLVDEWLFSRMEKAQLERLLEFDGETAAIIGENNNLDDFVDIMTLNDGETSDQPGQTALSDESDDTVQFDEPVQSVKSKEREQHQLHNDRLKS